MARCENKVDQTVPTRYSAKIVEMRCGQTSIHGDPLYCEECSARHEKAGHLPYECIHGVDLRPDHAMCMQCEFGDDDEVEAELNQTFETDEDEEDGTENAKAWTPYRDDDHPRGVDHDDGEGNAKDWQDGGRPCE